MIGGEIHRLKVTNPPAPIADNLIKCFKEEEDDFGDTVLKSLDETIFIAFLGLLMELTKPREHSTLKRWKTEIENSK